MPKVNSDLMLNEIIAGYGQRGAPPKIPGEFGCSYIVACCFCDKQLPCLATLPSMIMYVHLHLHLSVKGLI